MNRFIKFSRFFSDYAYSSPFVLEWGKIDRSNDLYWEQYEQALDIYLSSRDIEKSVARRYAALVESSQNFLDLRDRGDKHIATQLALIRVYVDLGKTEDAISECNRLITEISKSHDIQMTRPCLAPFSNEEQRPVRSGWNEWIKLSLNATKKHLAEINAGINITKNSGKTTEIFSQENSKNPINIHQPLLSICIPTFNRAAKLRACLMRLKEQLKNFPAHYEIVVSDNHSTDETRQIVESFDTLNIRYILREKNYGGFENSRFALKSGSGKYLCYVADDDSIRLDIIYRIVLRMQASPALVACFAPAATYDIKNKKIHALFGHDKSEVLIKRKDQKKLLDYILQNHAYPEIAIYRSQEFCQAFLANSQVAYEAFIWTSDILDLGDIIFLNEAYYYWHIPEFKFEADEELNLGHINAMNDWDRFRGGLDVILSKIIDKLNQSERQNYVFLTHRHAAIMLSLAIRLRYHHNYGDPNDLYYLSRRLIGMGYENMLPVPLSAINKKAHSQKIS